MYKIAVMGEYDSIYGFAALRERFAGWRPVFALWVAVLVVGAALLAVALRLCRRQRGFLR